MLPHRRRLPAAGCLAAPLRRFLDRRLAAAAFARREEGTHCSATGGLCHCTYVGVPASLRSCSISWSLQSASELQMFAEL